MIEYRVQNLRPISKEPSYTEFVRLKGSQLIDCTNLPAEILWLFNSERLQFHESDVKLIVDCIGYRSQAR